MWVISPKAHTVGIRLPATRNPFAGKGLGVTTALLVDPAREWSVADLAKSAEASDALASMVLRELRRRGLITGDLTRGRRATVRPTDALFDETALHWPAPSAWVAGGRVPKDQPVGGADVLRSIGITTESKPRVYVRSIDDIARLLAASGGALVSEPAADWEIAVLDYPLPAGPVPPIIAGLELGRSPRGRETLARHRRALLDNFPTLK
jgi:hypothetical protein